MARVAGTKAAGREVVALRQVMWLQPIVCTGVPIDVELHLSLHATGSRASFQVVTHKAHEPVLHAEGEVDYELWDNPEPLAVEAVQSRCTYLGSRTSLYEKLRELGFDYGPGFQVMERLYGNEEEGLAELKLPKVCEEDFALYGLHPGLLDGGLRSIFGMQGMINQSSPLVIPFYLEELVYYKPLARKSYAHAYKSAYSVGEQAEDVYYTDIKLSDTQGTVSAVLRGFSARAFRTTAPADVHSYAPTWVEHTLAAQNDLGAPVLVTGADEHNAFAMQVKAQLHGIEELISMQTDDYQPLLHDLQTQGRYPQTIVQLVSGHSTKAVLEWLSLFQAWQATNPEASLHWLVVYQADSSLQSSGYAALASLGRAVQLAAPMLTMKVIGVEPGRENSMQLLTEMAERVNGTVLYKGTKRYSRSMREIQLVSRETKATLLRQQGVYLITGGMGGLGKLFARYLAKQYQAKLVLTGRSVMDAAKEQFLQEIKELGGDALYQVADIGESFEQVQQLITTSQAHFGALNGILHAAGVVGSTLATVVDKGNFIEQSRAKTQGLIDLDEASKHCTLDFLVAFSSIAAEVGDYGVGSYSYGNRFMDEYLALRAKEGKAGVSLPIQWPYWAEGGMHLPEEEGALYFDYSGMQLLQVDAGIKAFEQALVTGESTVLLVPGNKAKIERILGLSKKLNSRRCEQGEAIQIGTSTEPSPGLPRLARNTG